MAERAESLVAPTGSNWQHRQEISRNGWKGFDFGFEVGPSYFSWLELIDSIDGRALRCARLIKLLDTKSGKMVGVSIQTANHCSTMISLMFHHSQKREFLQKLPIFMLPGSL